MKRKWQIREKSILCKCLFYYCFYCSKLFPWVFSFPLIKFSKYWQLTKCISKECFLSYSLLALSLMWSVYYNKWNTLFFLDLDRAKCNCFTHLYTKRNDEISKHSFFFFYVVGQKYNVPMYPGQRNHIKWFPKI